jgi:hypothetical protein
MAVAPAQDVEIIDNWHVMGMQGTGSHDLSVTDKFYAEAWTCMRGAPGVIDEPLYRYPSLAYQAQSHAAVNLGWRAPRSICWPGCPRAPRSCRALHVWATAAISA